MYFFDQTDSTNRVTRELAAEGKPAGTVVRAACQSAGRGQHGRTFSSPVGGLYFSLLLEPDLPPDTLPLITLATGLACRTVLHRQYGLHPLIKWPNDLYLEGKKVAGILCENLFYPRVGKPSAKVIIGVGLNANTTATDYDVEIQPIITTLFDHLQRSIDLDELCARLIESITTHVERLGSDRHGLLCEWQQHDFLHRKQLTYLHDTTRLTGLGYGVTPEGLYRIVDGNGREHRVIGGQLRPVMPGVMPSN